MAIVGIPEKLCYWIDGETAAGKLQIVEILFATDVGGLSVYNGGWLVKGGRSLRLFSAAGVLVDRKELAGGEVFAIGDAVRFSCHVALCVAPQRYTVDLDRGRMMGGPRRSVEENRRDILVRRTDAVASSTFTLPSPVHPPCVADIPRPGRIVPPWRPSGGRRRG